jgi:hypothetical protein
MVPPMTARWRHCLPAVAAVLEVDAGRLQEIVTTWRPKVWLKTTHTFSPLSMQHSKSAVKSAAVMAGSDLAQASSPTLAHAPPLTTLTQVGEVG